MRKRILLAGTLGAASLILWAFVANAIFGFSSRVELKRVPDERTLYEALRTTVKVPGVYIVDAQLPPDGTSAAGEPVYGVRYGGIGHEQAGRMLVFELSVTWVATTLAATLLSFASGRVRRHYGRSVLFLAGIGLLLALAGDVSKLGIGGYPVTAALLIAANRAAAWAVAALVMAGTMRPRGGAAAADLSVAAIR